MVKTTLSITMNTNLVEHVDERVETGPWDSRSEFIEYHIRQGLMHEMVFEEGSADE